MSDVKDERLTVACAIICSEALQSGYLPYLYPCSCDYASLMLDATTTCCLGQLDHDAR
jgi:hypothetical protein